MTHMTRSHFLEAFNGLAAPEALSQSWANRLTARLETAGYQVVLRGLERDKEGTACAARWVQHASLVAPASGTTLHLEFSLLVLASENDRTLSAGGTAHVFQDIRPQPRHVLVKQLATVTVPRPRIFLRRGLARAIAALEPKLLNPIEASAGEAAFLLALSKLTITAA